MIKKLNESVRKHYNLLRFKEVQLSEPTCSKVMFNLE